MKSAFCQLCVVTTFMAAVSSFAFAEQCNPAIDGTYCATQGGRVSDVSLRNSTTMSFGGIGSGSTPGSYDQPGTLGAITFSGDGHGVLVYYDAALAGSLA